MPFKIIKRKKSYLKTLTEISYFFSNKWTNSFLNSIVSLLFLSLTLHFLLTFSAAQQLFINFFYTINILKETSSIKYISLFSTFVSQELVASTTNRQSWSTWKKYVHLHARVHTHTNHCMVWMNIFLNLYISYYIYLCNYIHNKISVCHSLAQPFSHLNFLPHPQTHEEQLFQHMPYNYCPGNSRSNYSLHFTYYFL